MTRWVMGVAALAATLPTLAFAAPAHASPDLGQPIDLQAALDKAAGRDVSITVDTELPGSWGGGAWPGLPYVYIGRDAYNDAQVGGGHGLMVLLHEWGHTTGIDDEADANCFALAHLASFIDANWSTGDTWLHAEARAYQQAYGSMRAQSAEYQCAGSPGWVAP